MGHAQKAAGQVGRLRRHGTVPELLKPDVRRHALARRPELRDDRAEGGRHPGRQRLAGQEHPVGHVVNRNVVAHRADHAVAIRKPGEPRHQFAHLESRNRGRDRPVWPADLGRSIGLGVPRIELAEAAVLVDENARLLPDASIRRRRGTIGGEELGKTEPEEGDHPAPSNCRRLQDMQGPCGFIIAPSLPTQRTASSVDPAISSALRARRAGPQRCSGRSCFAGGESGRRESCGRFGLVGEVSQVIVRE